MLVAILITLIIGVLRLGRIGVVIARNQVEQSKQLGFIIDELRKANGK